MTVKNRISAKLSFWASVSLVQAFCAAQSHAQSNAAAYPNKPVTIILGVAPGASNDIETRLYAQKLSESMKQSFLVDFRPGAGQTIAAAFVAKAADDGYTLLNITPSFTLTPAFYKDLAYDPIKNFAAISMTSKIPYALLTTPSLPVNSIPALVAYSKANPDKVNFGTAGAGGFPHVVAAWLMSLTGARFTFVHYKGGAPSYAAAISLSLIHI